MCFRQIYVFTSAIVIKQMTSRIVTCNLIASFSIDSASQKWIVKHRNGNLGTRGYCNSHKSREMSKSWSCNCRDAATVVSPRTSHKDTFSVPSHNSEWLLNRAVIKWGLPVFKQFAFDSYFPCHRNNSCTPLGQSLHKIGFKFNFVTRSV